MMSGFCWFWWHIFHQFSVNRCLDFGCEFSHDLKVRHSWSKPRNASVISICSVAIEMCCKLKCPALNASICEALFLVDFHHVLLRRVAVEVIRK
ncbi:hypothetical protein KC19_2G066800 [Ceratodon purpureus]|uniref:Secreted protein n=1 Tax=Ceratodon purpureus TaxID=3225 RepID=A0A8T0ITQ3_CERPU|nr:hypothetical protein KC19_2G066800 [Ceratodon purpureus]